MSAEKERLFLKNVEEKSKNRDVCLKWTSVRLSMAHNNEPVFLNLTENVSMPPFAGFASQSFVWHVRLFVAFPGQAPWGPIGTPQ